MAPENADIVVWIKSTPGDDDQYHVYLEMGDDAVVPMSMEDGYAWAREVMSAVMTAEHDAAVFKQLRHIGVEPQAAGMMLKELRTGRPEVYALPSSPRLALRPGVSAFSSKPFLHVLINGMLVGQWDMDDARRHALAMIESFHAAQLDSAYLRALMEQVGLERANALSVIGDLGSFRE